MAKYLDYEGIMEFLQNIVEAPIADDYDYVLGVKDGKLAKAKVANVYLLVPDGDIYLDYEGTAVGVAVESNTNWIIE